jgi:hypothetical protein
MRIITCRLRSKVPSLVVALACNSSWTSTSSAFIPSSVSVSIHTSSLTASAPTPILHKFRGGSILHLAEESINGEDSKGKASGAESKKASTGWNHNLPDETSPFWTGEKELPKNLASAIDNNSYIIPKRWFLQKKERRIQEIQQGSYLNRQ